MTIGSDLEYRPACLPDQAGSCTRCGLAYDCRTKMRGRLVAWPVVALVVAAGLALVSTVA